MGPEQRRTRDIHRTQRQRLLIDPDYRRNLKNAHRLANWLTLGFVCLAAWIAYGLL